MIVRTPTRLNCLHNSKPDQRSHLLTPCLIRSILVHSHSYSKAMTYDVHLPHGGGLVSKCDGEYRLLTTYHPRIKSCTDFLRDQTTTNTAAGVNITFALLFLHKTEKSNQTQPHELYLVPW